MEKFLSNPELPSVNPAYKGNYFQNGQFSNTPWPDTDAAFGKVFRWFLSPNPQRREKKKDDFKPGLIKDESLFELHEDAIVWLGHAGFFIRFNGVNIMIDPVFTDLPLLKRNVGIPFSFGSIKNIDVVLLSHCHRDHFDESSLHEIFSRCPNVKILAPLRSEKLIRNVYKKALIQEAGWFQKFTMVSSPEITFLPALHWHRRGLTDFNEVLWGSFLIRNQNTSIYFAGDTAYGSHFQEIKNICGAPDICLLPIGAYKPSFLMQKSHTSPEEATKAFSDLEGKTFIPMHYGTYDLANEPIGEPIRKLRSIIHSDCLAELKVGEKFFLKKA